MINTHLLDSSYEGIDLLSLENNISDFVEVVTRRKNNGISRFTYDDNIYEVNTKEGNFANVLYGDNFDKQTAMMFDKTLCMCNNLKVKIERKLTHYKLEIESSYGIDHKIHEFSFWGFDFPQKEYFELSSNKEEREYHQNCIETNLKNNHSLFWILKDLYLPNLSFLEDVQNEMKDIIGKDFELILVDLKELNDYCSNISTFNFRDFNTTTVVKISDESDTVKQNPRLSAERTFNIPGIGSTKCFLHLKTGDIRTYIYFDKNQKQMWVVKIGQHMQTAKF